MKGGDQSGVNRELGPMPKGQSIGHNFQPASVQIVEHCQVHVSHVHVRGDPGPCLAADLSSSALERKAPSPQDPSHSTRCTMVAKHVKLAATSAGVHGEGKGQVQPSAQEKTERLSVHLGCFRSREGSEWS